MINERNVLLPFDLRVLFAENLSNEDRAQLFLRPKIDFSGVFSKVEPILQLVKDKGDTGLRELTAKFDGVDILEEGIVIDVADLSDDGISTQDKQAFDVAYENIRKFHAA